VCVEDPAQLSAEPLIEAASAPVADIGMRCVRPDRDVSHEEPDKRAQGVRYLKGCIDLAADVGSPTCWADVLRHRQSRLLPQSNVNNSAPGP